jgi:hypothetical protein
VIAVAILITIFVILGVIMLRAKEHIMVLEELIPEGRIISHEEGIVEYQGVYYVFGTHDLHSRNKLLKSLPEDVIQNPCIVDMRFDSQVIIRKGPVNDRRWLGPEELP